MWDFRPRPRRWIVIALGVAALAWVAGIAVATLAARNAPETSRIDTELDGVQEPTTVEQPTTTVPKEPDPTAAQEAEGPCWPVYGRTSARTSDGSDLNHGIPKTRVWQMRIGMMEFPPSFCDGVVYINNERGVTRAIQVEPKRVVWMRQVAEVFDSTPAVSGARVFVGTYRPGGVQALDRATGKVLWKLRTGGAVEASPVVVGGLVYATSKDRRVYAIDEATGKVRWAFLTGGEVKDSPSVVGGRVYVANYAGEVFSLDARTGKVVWRKTFGGVLGDKAYSSVAISGRTAYFTSIRGKVLALDTRDGSTRWEKSIPGYVYATPAVAGGKVFVGNYPGRIYAFDARTGRESWSANVGGSISGSPVVIGDVVYVSSNRAKVTRGYSVKNGRELWKLPDGRYVPGIATDRAIYFSTGNILSRWTSAQSERAFGVPTVYATPRG